MATSGSGGSGGSNNGGNSVRPGGMGPGGAPKYPNPLAPSGGGKSGGGGGGSGADKAPTSTPGAATPPPGAPAAAKNVLQSDGRTLHLNADGTISGTTLANGKYLSAQASNTGKSVSVITNTPGYSDQVSRLGITKSEWEQMNPAARAKVAAQINVNTVKTGGAGVLTAEQRINAAQGGVITTAHGGMSVAPEKQATVKAQAAAALTGPMGDLGGPKENKLQTAAAKVQQGLKDVTWRQAEEQYLRDQKISRVQWNDGTTHYYDYNGQEKTAQVNKDLERATFAKNPHLVFPTEDKGVDIPIKYYGKELATINTADAGFALKNYAKAGARGVANTLNIPADLYETATWGKKDAPKWLKLEDTTLDKASWLRPTYTGFHEVNTEELKKAERELNQVLAEKRTAFKQAADEKTKAALQSDINALTNTITQSALLREGARKDKWLTTGEGAAALYAQLETFRLGGLLSTHGANTARQAPGLIGTMFKHSQSISKPIGTAANAGFGISMLKGGYEGTKQAKAEWDAGQREGAQATGAHALASLALGTKVGYEAGAPLTRPGQYAKSVKESWVTENRPNQGQRNLLTNEKGEPVKLDGKPVQAAFEGRTDAERATMRGIHEAKIILKGSDAANKGLLTPAEQIAGKKTGVVSKKSDADGYGNKHDFIDAINKNGWGRAEELKSGLVKVTGLDGSSKIVDINPDALPSGWTETALINEHGAIITDAHGAAKTIRMETVASNIASRADAGYLSREEGDTKPLRARKDAPWLERAEINVINKARDRAAQLYNKARHPLGAKNKDVQKLDATIKARDTPKSDATLSNDDFAPLQRALSFNKDLAGEAQATISRMTPEQQADVIGKYRDAMKRLEAEKRFGDEYAPAGSLANVRDKRTELSPGPLNPTKTAPHSAEAERINELLGVSKESTRGEQPKPPKDAFGEDYAQARNLKPIQKEAAKTERSDAKTKERERVETSKEREARLKEEEAARREEQRIRDEISKGFRSAATTPSKKGSAAPITDETKSKIRKESGEVRDETADESGGGSGGSSGGSDGSGDTISNKSQTETTYNWNYPLPLPVIPVGNLLNNKGFGATGDWQHVDQGPARYAQTWEQNPYYRAFGEQGDAVKETVLDLQDTQLAIAKLQLKLEHTKGAKAQAKLQKSIAKQLMRYRAGQLRYAQQMTRLGKQVAVPQYNNNQQTPKPKTLKTVVVKGKKASGAAPKKAPTPGVRVVRKPQGKSTIMRTLMRRR